jgi:glycosyltransferase involved in cell wall biosynthesis
MCTKVVVSVLMPVFNGEKYLAEAIESILNQTYSDFEFIIINDGSTDGTVEILERYRRQDHRIKVFNQSNQGLVKSLNRGINLAQGDYVARMDQDDLSAPERLEVQTAVLRSHPEIGLVCSAARIIDHDGLPIRLHAPNFSPEHFFFFLNYKNCIVHSSVLFRREIANLLGGYDESMLFIEDYEFWCRFSKVTRIYQLDQELVCWRQHASNISARNKEIVDQAVHEAVGKNLWRLTGRQISRDELTKMQYECPENENELTKIVALLTRVCGGILKQESRVIKTLKLNENQIKHIANDRRERLLYGYFRRLKFMEYPGFFFRVGARHLFFFGRKIFLAIVYKVLHRPAQ